jgi:phospholipase/carboxylesterase
MIRLGLGDERDVLLYVPDNAGDDRLPLLVLLHGASGSGERQLGRLGALPNELRLPVLAPDSRQPKWDILRGGFADDVTFIDRALARVFQLVSVDPGRVWLAGFSDGATYALSLGLANGDMFSRLLAFSPGFIVVDGPLQGRPRIFVSHGTSDSIIPIDHGGRLIVPALRKIGYDVTFREFEGGHEIPPAIAREGLTWAFSSGPDSYPA